MVVEPEHLISLIEVIPTQEQTHLLYEQLKCRLYNISHEQLPSFEQHNKFVENHPYRKWYLIEISGSIVGSLYVQNDNSVGINCIQKVSCDHLKNIMIKLRNEIKPLPAVASVRYKDFFINVPANNTEFQSLLTQIGYHPSQISFVLNK